MNFMIRVCIYGLKYIFMRSDFTKVQSLIASKLSVCDDTLLIANAKEAVVEEDGKLSVNDISSSAGLSEGSII